MRSRSSVVGPARRPWSRSAWRTQWRSVSAEPPIFSAIERIAAYCEPCSFWCSKTMRTARARTSGEYGGVRFVMAPSSQESEPPGISVRFSPSVGFDFGADGARAMILVYNLPAVPALFEPYGGIDGPAYFVGGRGTTAPPRGEIPP